MAPNEPPEDDLEAGTMTLLEHIQELRSRVFWAGAAVAVGMLVFFVPPIGFGAIDFLMRPAVHELPTFRAQAISPMENVIVYFRVALLGGIALGMPMLVFQAMRFVTPALTRSEKKWIIPIVAGGSIAFIGGMAFGYFVMLPAAYGFLFTFGSSFAEITPTISSYIDLTTRLLLIAGLVFETPIFIMGLAKIGIVNARKLLGWWRIMIVAVFAIAAVLTPTPDPVTQSLVAAPMIGLYFVGVLLAWLVRRN